MVDLKKVVFAIASSVAVLPLAAQEPWDAHFKLTAGIMNNAEDDLLGQNKVYGLALAGAYKFSIHGSVVVDGGYKFFPSLSVTQEGTTLEDETDIYYASAMYRHEIWRNGLYVQGGLRVSNARTVRDVILRGMGLEGKDDRHKIKADRQTKAGWVIGGGYRLTDLWSVEVGASSASFMNVAGNSIKGTIFEIALCIHR